MRTVDFDRNVDILVRWCYGNRDIFEEGPCCWFRTRRRVFLSRIFSGEESATLHDHSRSGRFWRALLLSLRMFGNIAECGCRLSETFFVHKNSIRAHHAEHADRSLVSQEFESVYSQMQVHSSFCQTWSLETRLWVSAHLRMIIGIR